MRIYNYMYKYNRDIQESGYDDLYVKVHRLRTRPICKVKIFVRGRYQGSYYCSNLRCCRRIYKFYRNAQESGHNYPYVLFDGGTQGGGIGKVSKSGGWVNVKEGKSPIKNLIGYCLK